MTMPFPPAPAPAQRPGILPRLFGGPDPMRGGLLDVLQTKRLGGSALTQAGLAMLEASGRGQGIGSVLASGVRGGQQGYQAGFEGLQQTGAAAQQQQLAQQRQQIMQKYAGRTDVESMQGMLSDLIAIGDIEAAKPLAGYLNAAVNAQAGQGQQFHRPIEIKTTDANGKPVTALIDPITRQKLAEFPATETRDALTSLTLYQKESLDRNDRLFQASQANQMYDDYRLATNNVKVAAENWSIIASTAEPAKRGDAAAQMALVFSFMKMLDPGSTVREGEYANAENARGVSESVRNQYNKVLNGQFLTPEQVERFVGQARVQSSAWRARQKVTSRSFAERAKRRGLNPGDVVFDWFADIEDQQPSGGSKLESMGF